MPSDEADALIWNADRLRTASKAAGVALWSWNVDKNDLHMNERAYALLGVPRNGPLTFDKLSMHIYPPDRVKVQRAIEATRTTPGPARVDRPARMGLALMEDAVHSPASVEARLAELEVGIAAKKAAIREMFKTKDFDSMPSVQHNLSRLQRERALLSKRPA